MKLQFFGGATAILEHQGIRIMFDPWLDEGIFHGAWYHYPPLQVGIKDIGRVDYIYISHIHEDHCSPGTIKYINRDAEVIIMDRHPNFILSFLERYKFEFKYIHKLKPRTPTELRPSLVFDIIEPDPGYHEIATLVDSSLLIQWDNFVIYNANDCTPYPDAWKYIKETYKKVDLALLPYTGGSGYPACYHNLSHEEKLLEKQRIAAQGIQGFLDAVLYLEPKYCMPFADQYVIGGSRAHLNQYLPHPPDGSVVLETLKTRGLDAKLLLLNSGQVFDLETGKKIPDETYKSHTEQERQSYISSLGEKVYDHEKITISPNTNLSRLLNYSRLNLWNAQEKLNIFPNFRYSIDVSDREISFLIDMKVKEVNLMPYLCSIQEPYLRIKVSSTLLLFLLVGHISWNIADAALFIDYERRPNIYHPIIHALLNYLKI